MSSAGVRAGEVEIKIRLAWHCVTCLPKCRLREHNSLDTAPNRAIQVALGCFEHAVSGHGSAKEMSLLKSGAPGKAAVTETVRSGWPSHKARFEPRKQFGRDSWHETKRVQALKHAKRCIERSALCITGLTNTPLWRGISSNPSRETQSWTPVWGSGCRCTTRLQPRKSSWRVL